MPAQTVIQLRRDTEANWISVDPTLAAGEIGYDSTNNQLKVGNGTDEWTVLPYASGAGGASVEISETAPADPEAGDVWFNSTEGRAYIYYDSFWIDLNPGIAGPAGKFTVSATAPEDAVSGDGWFNSELAKLFIYYDEFWVEATGNRIGPSGIIAVNSPIVNSGTSTAANLSIDYNAFQYGRNAIINGGFDIFQRGDTTEVLAATSYFPADRWNARRTSFFGSGVTFTRTANPGVQGLNNSLRSRRNTGTTATNGVELFHSLEIRDSVQLQGETVTLSFYARKGADYSVVGSTLTVGVFTGTGTTSDRSLRDGFTNQAQPMSLTATLTTDWERFTVTGTLASGINQVGLLFASGPFVGTAGANDWFEITGVQLEAGPAATPFRRNAPSIQAELAACQRYYQRYGGKNVFEPMSLGFAASTTSFRAGFKLTTTMRIAPTSVGFSSVSITDDAAGYGLTALVFDQAGADFCSLTGTVASGLTQFRPYRMYANNSLSAFVDFSAEL
jgi:hypothetical protein